MLVGLSFALLAAAGRAEVLPGGVQLGMSALDLQQAVPGLQRVRRPQHLAGGLVGRWSGPSVQVAGIALTPTFFFQHEELLRVEYDARRDAGSQAFDALLAWGRTAWGQELASQSPEGVYATWSDTELDAYLQRTNADAVRLVIKRRVLKDDSEL